MIEDYDYKYKYTAKGTLVLDNSPTANIGKIEYGYNTAEDITAIIKEFIKNYLAKDKNTIESFFGAWLENGAEDQQMEELYKSRLTPSTPVSE